MNVSKRITISISLLANFLSACSGGFKAAVSESTLSTASVCCGSPSALPRRTGLLDNPGFEFELAGWEDWGLSTLSAQAAHSGSKGLRLLPGVSGRGQEVLFRLKTGASYTLKAFARLSNAGDEAYIGIRFFDMNNNSMGDQRARITSTSFKEYSVAFQLPPSVSSAKIYAYKVNAGGGNVDADDFSLLQTSAPVNPPMLTPVSNFLDVRPSGPTGNWSLVWAEEFLGGAIDNSKWNLGMWFDYSLPGELQAYRPENISVSNDHLQLTAQQRATTTTWGEARNYASGAITSMGKFAFTFGVLEARLKVPAGQGLNAQLWLLPYAKRSPPQIDLLKVNGASPNIAHMSYAWLDDNGLARGQSSQIDRGDLSAMFHTLTLEWLPDHISYFIDGVLVYTYSGEFVLRDPAFIILNLVVGGNSGIPSPSSIFPQALEVDYVRVWQRPL